MKKIISFVLAVILSFSMLAVYSSAAQKKVVANAADTSSFAMDEMTYSTAPIKIVKAKLTAEGKTQDIYFVGLIGTKTHKNQVNVVGTYLAALFGVKKNAYTKYLKQVMAENIPADSKLVITGHSLGGMVAQQIAADKEIQEKYDIIAVVTEGSPYMMLKTEGILNRLGDTSDMIPKMGLATILAPGKQFGTLIKEKGGYGMDFDGAHNLSYLNAELWGKYDALGVLGGDAKITYDESKVLVFGEVK